MTFHTTTSLVQCTIRDHVIPSRSILKLGSNVPTLLALGIGMGRKLYDTALPFYKMSPPKRENYPTHGVTRKQFVHPWNGSAYMPYMGQ